MKFHYTYKTTCTVTGRYYLGLHSTSKLDDGYLGSGKVISCSIRKHGKENHTREILKEFATRKDAAAHEVLIIEECKHDSLCMNLKPGGDGGWQNVYPWPPSRSRKLSSDRIAKLVAANSGKHRSDETKAKISEANIGKHHITHTEEAKEKIRLGNLKMAGESNGFFGKTHSEESKAKFKDRRYVHNHLLHTCVKASEVERFLAAGWALGKGLRYHTIFKPAREISLPLIVEVVKLSIQNVSN